MERWTEGPPRATTLLYLRIGPQLSSNKKNANRKTLISTEKKKLQKKTQKFLRAHNGSFLIHAAPAHFKLIMSRVETIQSHGDEPCFH